MSAYGATLSITDGVTLTGSGGSGPGMINLTGNYSHLSVVGTTKLGNATINIGNAATYSYLDSDDTTGTGAVLTLGIKLAMTQTGTAATTAYLLDSGNANDSTINQGSIGAGARGGQFTVGENHFTNQGSITVSNGDTFNVMSTSFANYGSISVSGGGVLDLGGTVATRVLGSITPSSCGTVRIDGLLNNAGATQNVGAGTALGTVTLGGTIAGGTIHDAGSGFVFNSGTLDGVTYQGTLDMSADYATLSIRDGITLNGSGGSGPGTANLTGNYSHLYVVGTTALTQAGHYGALYTGGYAKDQIINQGSISAAFTRGRFLVKGNSFTNQGSITVANGEAFTFRLAKFVNLSGGTPTGGSYEVDAGSTIELNNNNVAIVTDNANITLSGTGSVIEGYNTTLGKELTIARRRWR